MFTLVFNLAVINFTTERTHNQFFNVQYLEFQKTLLRLFEFMDFFFKLY